MEKASKKVENGKLVKAELSYSDKIDDIKIHGDFFIEPPEALEEIMEKLTGLKAEREILIENIESVDAELIGFSAEDLADVIMEVVNND
jgi:hypothetical protein